MSGGAKSVPKLRFPGFVGEWDEKRLGAFFEEFKEKSTEQDQFEVLTSARTGLVRQKDYYDNDRITDRDNVGFNVIPPKYLTYRSRSDDRRFFFNENNLGITGVISVYYPVFRIVDGDNNFFVELLARHSNHLGKFSVGTSQTVLSMNELKRIKLPIPKSNEQKEIAAFLGVVDAKIAALRARVLGLQAYKRGLMQALFSQTRRFTKPDGTAFPDWEEKRLGEVFAEVKDRVGDTDMPTFSISAGRGFVSQEERFGKDISGQQNERYTALKVGDFSYNKGNSITYKYGCIYENRTGMTIAVPNVFISFRPKNKKMSGSFFGKLFEDHHLDKGLRTLISSGARMNGLLNVNKDSFFKLSIPVPHLDEQAKIAEALSAMDAKIAAVQDQVLKMQDFKKGLLQQMFV